MNERFSASALATFVVVIAGVTIQGQTIPKSTLSLDGARKVIAAAKMEASKKGAPGAVIAVVDDGGNLMALERLDGTFAAGANISIGKARTAALFKKPTRVFEELINKSRTAMTALTDFTPLQGGVPIVLNDQIVGGVGVSGAASAQQDEELAMAGAGAFTNPESVATAGVTNDSELVSYIGADQVSAAFAKGMPLLETGAYKVHASRRERDGQAEVHTRDTDILYVLEGSATLVTGGRVISATTVAPDEQRGEAIAHGESRTLVKGDVVVIPNGVPHQFKDVTSPFLYYVVKVTAPRSQS
jgi:glc operon protein GlcG